MLHRVALVRNDVSEERSPSIRVKRIGELGTMLTVTSNRRMLLRGVRRLLVTANIVPSSSILVTVIQGLRSSETSFLQEQCSATSERTAFFVIRSFRNALQRHMQLKPSYLNVKFVVLCSCVPVFLCCVVPLSLRVRAPLQNGKWHGEAVTPVFLCVPSRWEEHVMFRVVSASPFCMRSVHTFKRFDVPYRGRLHGACCSAPS
jgi:hypothetical protein